VGLHENKQPQKLIEQKTAWCHQEKKHFDRQLAVLERLSLSSSLLVAPQWITSQWSGSKEGTAIGLV